MKNLIRIVFPTLLLLALAGTAASAQSIDGFAGLNALTASQALQNIPKLGGGIFPSAGASFYLGDIGIGAEVAFKGSQETFNGQGLRPMYYDINGLLQPITISRSLKPEFMLGLGAQSLRAFQGLTQCGTASGCTSYASSNHLMVHLGVGLKFYLTEHIFIRPEAHWYYVFHNPEFQTNNAERFGISLGYTLGGS